MYMGGDTQWVQLCWVGALETGLKLHCIVHNARWRYTSQTIECLKQMIIPFRNIFFISHQIIYWLTCNICVEHGGSSSMNRLFDTVLALLTISGPDLVPRLFGCRRAARLCFNIKDKIQSFDLKSSFYSKIISIIYCFIKRGKMHGADLEAVCFPIFNCFNLNSIWWNNDSFIWYLTALKNSSVSTIAWLSTSFNRMRKGKIIEYKWNWINIQY